MMETLFIEGQFNFPEVDFNANTGVLKLIGRSIPENPVKFYQPLEDWINTYIASSPKEFVFQIYLDYLNTHSTECMLMLMKTVAVYSEKGNADVKIIWIYDEDDEDMFDLGEDLSSIVNVPFELKARIEE